MLQAFIKMLLDAGYIWVAGAILITYIIGKFVLKLYAIIAVCKNPNLSDEKVDSLTKMISKNLFKS